MAGGPVLALREVHAIAGERFSPEPPQESVTYNVASSESRT